jgi:hypothetical protein
MEDMNIRRVMTHGEKAAAYVADGYDQASGISEICMVQTVGDANLAAGLQDEYLAGSDIGLNQPEQQGLPGSRMNIWPAPRSSPSPAVGSQRQSTAWWPESMAGSLRGLTRLTCRRPGRCTKSRYKFGARSYCPCQSREIFGKMVEFP